MNFKDLGLSDSTLSILNQIGYESPSEIQVAAIPKALSGKDIIGQAQTGTGKTASFALPIIEKTIAGTGIQNVILAPSRELAKQIQDEIIKLKGETAIRTALIIGGVSYDIQRRDIKRNPDILIATPGRLIDHLESKRIHIDLTNVKTLVLDEADEMLNFGFYKEMLRIAKFLPQEKQTLFFTATFNKRTLKLAEELLKSPVKISVSSGMSTSAKINQKYVVLKENQKLVTLYNLLQIYEHKSAIIFGRTKRRVDELSSALKDLGFKAQGIQGDMRQKERAHAMKSFRNKDTQILIGTDVLARGIDIDTVDLVINFDLPTEIEYYTHRIGRTGRAEREGTAISLVKEKEQFFFDKTMKETGSKAQLIKRPSDSDMMQVKERQLNGQLKTLLEVGKEKYKNISQRILEEFDPKHIALMLSASVIKNGKSPYKISLTGEPGADVNKKNRSQGKSRNKNFGSSRRPKANNFRQRQNSRRR